MAHQYRLEEFIWTFIICTALSPSPLCYSSVTLRISSYINHASSLKWQYNKLWCSTCGVQIDLFRLEIQRRFESSLQTSLTSAAYLEPSFDNSVILRGSSNNYPSSNLKWQRNKLWCSTCGTPLDFIHPVLQRKTKNYIFNFSL